MNKSKGKRLIGEARRIANDLINQLLEHHPRFRKLLRQRLKEKTVSVAEALKQI
ncbi:MAG: hypothetical protein L0Y71_09090 [Gemmataceae bacterium]|nr:hypothetical protein [Gemmataceae bacterium]